MFPFTKLSVEIFGESHADRIGVRIKNLPRGAVVDAAAVQAFVDERKAGKNPWSTPRNEPDVVLFTSGLENGTITGDVTAVIKNTSQRSKDYDKLRFTPRPSHADYVATIKDGENVSLSGGGRFSGRMTAPLCIAGGIALQLLEQKGVRIASYVSEIGGVKGKSYSGADISFEDVEKMKENGCFALENTDKMVEKVLSARQKGDSVGGSAECIVFGAPVGLGDNLFNGLEGKISAAVFGIPAVKSVEFGLGRGFASACGSQANDPFCIKDGKVATVTNNNGGINGGISNGMPITLRATFKPTPSISLPQKTVDLQTMTETEIVIGGRHDACIVPRAVPALKAAVALSILDAMSEENLI